VSSSVDAAGDPSGDLVFPNETRLDPRWGCVRLGAAAAATVASDLRAGMLMLGISVDTPGYHEGYAGLEGREKKVMPRATYCRYLFAYVGMWQCAASLDLQEPREK